MTAQAVRYLSYKGKAACHGCAARLEKYRQDGQQGPAPLPKKPTWRRVQGAREWPLCSEHKVRWEAHDRKGRQG